MNNMEKIEEISFAINNPNIEDMYYSLLERMGDIKRNYWEYMTTEPIDCEKELKRLSEADYELCTALLTMLLREDHFSNGSFRERYEKGQVDDILNKMIQCLSRGKKDFE